MRCTKLTGLFAILLAFTVTLAAAPQPAEAGKACKKLKLGRDCVRSSDVKNLQAKDLKDEAGADFTFTDTDFTLSATDETVLSLNIVAPRPGVVLVNASANVLGSSAVNESARCSITTDTILDPVHFIQSETDGSPDNYDPISISRGFEVVAGTSTFNLVCDSALNTPTITYSSMTAAYYPTRY